MMLKKEALGMIDRALPCLFSHGIGETANGDFPFEAVSTMAAIAQNAEEMVAVHKR